MLTPVDARQLGLTKARVQQIATFLASPA